ncbi:PAS domain-containing sensor histidine kinase [Niabella insulamsoli]|uniref:PAS domain-containing sensor histidine kinase n=1 Tax=Niabella insulamsoli TaxID=3144874 RepID=UPI0031FC65B7
MLTDLTSAKKEIVIDAFKSFAYLIFEVSREEVITNVWAKNPAEEQEARAVYLGKRSVEINNGNITAESVAAIRKAFASSEVHSVDYIHPLEQSTLRFAIKILKAPYDDNFVLVLIERTETNEVVEDKWHLALDAVGDGIWDANLQTGKIFFSSKWQEIFGYSENEIRTTDEWRAKIHPQDLEAATRLMAEHIKGNTPAYISEIRYLCKDGTYRWILSRGLVTSYTEDGKPLRFIGTHNDIHERKLKDIANLEDKQRYKVLFDHSVALICTHDLNGKILNVNPYASELLQYGREELIGRNIADLVPEKYRKDVQLEYLSAIVNSATAEGVLRMLSKEGSIKHLLYKNYLFSNADGEKYVIAFAHDITERLRAESGLRTSEKIFSTYFNLSGIGMAIVSPAGKWEKVNDALCRITGYSPAELADMHFADITHPEDRDRDVEAKERMLRREIESYEVEKRYITKDGRVIWVSLTTALVRSAAGHPKFFIAQFVDITARKNLTNQLHTKNNELNQAKEELLGKVKELEEISHAIGHNLRGPAKNINLLTKVLNVKVGKTTEPEEAYTLAESFTLDELVSMIDTVGIAMTNSLETLLNIAEIRLNKELPFDDCGFEEAIDSVLSMLAGDIHKKRIQVNKALEVERILYPKPYLESILYNLISNAIKYSSPFTDSKIWIQTGTQANGEVTLSVKDNGFGIDMDKFGKKIFKLSQVFHKNTDSKGVGLYLTKTQIESLNGKINVESKLNEGSTFMVTFAPSSTLASNP